MREEPSTNITSKPHGILWPWVVDVLVVSSIGVILLLLFLLPLAVKDPLRLFSGNATVAAVFGSNYVHFDFWNHLMPNVVAFLGTGLIASLVLGYIGRRRLFYKVVIFNLLVSPWVISSLWLVLDARFFSPLSPSYGFSGIDAAFAGALAFSFLLWLGGVMKFRLSHGVVAAIVFIPFTFSVTYVALIGVLALEYAVVGGSIFVGFFYRLYRTVDPEVRLKRGTKPSTARKVYVLSLPYLVLLIFSVLMFPLQLRTGNGEVNIFVHYTGLVIGILSAYLLSRWGGQVRGRPLSPNPST